jgi:hypothetical protein
LEATGDLEIYDFTVTRFGLQGDERNLGELCTNAKTAKPDRAIVTTGPLALSCTLLSMRAVRNSMNKYTGMNPLRTTSPTIFSNSNPAKE